MYINSRIIQTKQKRFFPFFSFFVSEEKLDSMAEVLNEAYQQQNDRINQLQILFLFAQCTLTHKLCDKGKNTEISTRTDCA